MTAPLVEVAAEVGHLVAVERRGFEAVGGWVPAETDPAARAVWAACSRRHAWRAAQLEAQLAPFGGRTIADLCVPPDAAVPLLAVLDGAVTTAARATAATAVAAFLAARMDALADRCSSVADAALLRTLELVSLDLRTDRASLATVGREGDFPS